MSHPHSLSSLSTREAIIDTVHRVVIAFDYNDVELLNSAFAGEDIILSSPIGTITDLSTLRNTVCAPFLSPIKRNKQAPRDTLPSFASQKYL